MESKPWKSIWEVFGQVRDVLRTQGKIVVLPMNDLKDYRSLKIIFVEGAHWKLFEFSRVSLRFVGKLESS